VVDLLGWAPAGGSGSTGGGGGQQRQGSGGGSGGCEVSKFGPVVSTLAAADDTAEVGCSGIPLPNVKGTLRQRALGPAASTLAAMHGAAPNEVRLSVRNRMVNVKWRSSLLIAVYGSIPWQFARPLLRHLSREAHMFRAQLPGQLKISRQGNGVMAWTLALLPVLPF